MTMIPKKDNRQQLFPVRNTLLSKQLFNLIYIVVALCCLVVKLANTPMESNGQGWVRVLFSHVCLGLSV